MARDGCRCDRCARCARFSLFLPVFLVFLMSWSVSGVARVDETRRCGLYGCCETLQIMHFSFLLQLIFSLQICICLFTALCYFGAIFFYFVVTLSCVALSISLTCPFLSPTCLFNAHLHWPFCDSTASMSFPFTLSALFCSLTLFRDASISQSPLLICFFFFLSLLFFPSVSISLIASVFFCITFCLDLINFCVDPFKAHSVVFVLPVRPRRSYKVAVWPFVHRAYQDRPDARLQWRLHVSGWGSSHVEPHSGECLPSRCSCFTPDVYIFQTNMRLNLKISSHNNSQSRIYPYLLSWCAHNIQICVHYYLYPFTP